jgi:phage terminase large subunit-like protein
LRRIRRALLSIARKNGKSALVAALLLVHLVGPEAKTNSEIYSVASDREQAGHVYKMAKQMVELDPELSQMCKCLDTLKRIVCYHNGNFYRALSADGRRQHGGNSALVIYDELAQALDRELYDVMSTSFGAQEEGLMIVISTQSSDPLHIMSELCDDARAQQGGLLDDPYFYGRVYEVPDDAAIYDEKNWYLANPGLGKFKDITAMRALAAKAKRSPSAEAAFKALELNMRVDGSQALVNSADWKACYQPMDIAALRRFPCYGGLDLSNRLDLTALTLSWVLDGGAKVFTQSWFWMPKGEPGDIETKEKRDGAQYLAWLKKDWIKATPGKSVSYREVINDIALITAGHDLKAIAFDRYRIDEFKREMEYAGIEETTFKLIEHGQGFKDMTPAVEALEERVVSHTLLHDANPVTTYCLRNVRVIQDPAGNRKFDKRDRNRRIDGAVTLAMSLSAIAKAEKPDGDGPSVYEKRGLRVL